MKLSNLTVRARLLAGFGSLVLVAVLLSALAISALGRNHGDFQKYVDTDAELLALANDVQNAANARAVGARNLVLATDTASRNGEVDAIKHAHEKVTASLSQLKSRVQQAGKARGEALISDIEKIESRYGPLALEIVKLAVEDQKELAITKMNNECRPLLAALLSATGAYIDHERVLGVETIEAATDAYAWSRNLLIAGCALAVTLATALALVITRNLTRSLGGEPSRLAEVAQQVASGNLAPIAEATRVWEGSVLASLSNMQRSLADVVGKVRGASDSIATASGEIATGTTDLSQRTEEQASNLQQTAAAMEQMNSTVKSNADTAHQATQLAASASTVAERGGQVVDQVVATMSDITASSKKISEIIGVIDGIAFQTNILALNAAVEAARAGEQGRGFAVVAGEVRTLARRSADAAKEIKMLIGDSVEKVDAGGRLVNEAGATMSEIVRQVRKVTDLIGEIGAATVEQSKGAEQISHAVTQLDDVTQQNAALVEESAAAADSLKQQAMELAKVVQTFTLDHGHGRPAPRAAQGVAARARRGSSAGQARPPIKAALVAPGWSEF